VTVNEDKIFREYTNTRLDKIETRLKDLDRLNATVVQYQGTIDKLDANLTKLQSDIKEELDGAVKKMLEATKIYVEDRLSGTTTAITTAGQQKQGGPLEQLFDRLSQPNGAIDRVINGVTDRFSNNLPLVGAGQQTPPTIQSEIVDLDRQLRNSATLLYRDALKDALKRVNAKVNVLETAGVKVTHSP
jgi:uncharacterized coiled-coil protein SlyX